MHPQSLGLLEGAGKRRVVVLRASPSLGRKPGWLTLKSLALSPLPSAPNSTPVWLCREIPAGSGAGAEVAAKGRGAGGFPLLNSRGPPSSGASRVAHLAFASSPIHFPFLSRTAPEHQRRNERVSQSPLSLRRAGWGARGCGGWQECLREAWTRNRVFPFGRHSDHVLKS